MCLVCGFLAFQLFYFLRNPSSNVHKTTNIFHGFLAFHGFSALHRFSAIHRSSAFQLFKDFLFFTDFRFLMDFYYLLWKSHGQCHTASCLVIKMQYNNAVSGYAKTGHLCLWKCKTTVLRQDIQKLTFFAYQNAILQWCLRISKKLGIFAHENAILQCCFRISKIWLFLGFL